MSKHRREIPNLFPSHVFDVQNNAVCQCRVSGWATCPRHNADTYADQQARHATDSLSPAERYHSGNGWGQ
jgi:hypothetical protein